VIIGRKFWKGGSGREMQSLLDVVEAAGPASWLIRNASLSDVVPERLAGCPRRRLADFRRTPTLRSPIVPGRHLSGQYRPDSDLSPGTPVAVSAGSEQIGAVVAAAGQTQRRQVFEGLPRGLCGVGRRARTNVLRTLADGVVFLFRLVFFLCARNGGALGLSAD